MEASDGEEASPAGTASERYLRWQSKMALGVAFVSFLTFACAEMAFAFISNSLALLGDAAAMMVDAMTYLGNFAAVQHQSRRGRPSRLLVAGPFLSAIALIGVMIYVCIDAIQELLGSGDSDVELTIVFAFGVSNLFLDFVNLGCFYAFPEAYRAILTFTDPESLEADGGLNIRSALTHVLADTYRSVAVIVSAGSALLFKDISPSKADAVGALVVEFPIVIMCFQICHAVYRRFIVPAGCDQPPTSGDDESSDDTRRQPFIDNENPSAAVI